MGRLIATLLLVGLASPAAARLRVCTLAFNGPEEVDVFRTHLRPEDFEIVDLSSVLAPAPTDGTTASLATRCPADLHCDVVVFSAEFGGHFFGRSGRSLSLQELEEASCQPRCAGLFHAPQEVFLLACNTLATKDQDKRTPADYLAVLRNHGFEEADAERVVAIRYGPLGQTFRETTRRIFAGVPRLYGFSAVAARGERTAVQLERYFESRGDYARHLLEAWDESRPNPPLKAAFVHTGMVQVSGLSRADSAAGDRDLVCRLYDDGAPLVDRLRVVRNIMARENALSFLPMVEAFLAEHDPATFGAEELVACLAPPDPALNVRLLAALDGGDESVRSWAAYALTRRLPLDDATLFDLASRADDESADVRQRVRWILAAQARPSEPVRHAHR